jgi:hypothetical protein
MVIQSVINDKVAFIMVVNMTMFFTRDTGMKTLGLKIKKNISIPRVGHANEKHRFIGERITRLSFFISMGKIADKFCKNQGIFSFRLGKLEIKFLKNNDPFGILSPKELTCQNMIHGVQFRNDHDSV